MNLNKRTAVLVSALAVVFTFASASSGQNKDGGYKAVSVDDRAVVAAANFAVSAQARRDGRYYEVGQIVKAAHKVGQGSNYRLCMVVAMNGKGDNGFYVQAVVYQDLQGAYTLTSWKYKCG